LIKKATYDIIIAGSGCAGLWLAYYLQKDAYFSNLSILMVDRSFEKTNDRHWCFWGGEEPILQEIICKTYPKMRFADASGDQVESVEKQPYHVIRGIDFYRKMFGILRKHPNIEWLEGEIDYLKNDQVWVDGRCYRSSYIFDSCVKGKEFPKIHYQVLQHFKGWVIETPDQQFDDQQLTLMDFSIPQKGAARFFYILPFSANKALVEFTIFSPALLERSEYDEVLTDYVQNTLGISDYTIEEVEYGSIPMTDYIFPKNNGEHIFHIGTKSGAVKPTTGYAFLRIQREISQLAEQVLGVWKKDLKFSPTFVNNSVRFRFYDILLLHILQNNPKVSARIFSALFRKNRFRQILTFLDEKSNIFQEIRIFASLPKIPFLEALWIQIKRALPSSISNLKKAKQQTQIKLHN